jgi:hypothetical protein
VNLPWLGSPTEATEPHQQGGSESRGFRPDGCPSFRILDPFLRTRPARLCRMGTRRRQLARGRFHALPSDTRRCPSVAHFCVVRISLRRVKSVVHSVPSGFDPEGSHLSGTTADSGTSSEEDHHRTRCFPPSALLPRKPDSLQKKRLPHSLRYPPTRPPSTEADGRLV